MPLPLPRLLFGIVRVVAMLIVCVLIGDIARENALAQGMPRSITVATWNLEWFYDDNQSDNHTDVSKELSAPTAADWEWKKQAVAGAIAELKPTILCLQEVEDRDVIFQLCKELEDRYRIKYRYAFISGYDFGTEQDVAIIYRNGLVEFSRREQTREMFESKEFYNLSKHIFARFQWGSGDNRESLLILNIHLRAGADHAGLRQRQCRLIHAWLDEAIQNGENVLVTGDFNTQFDSETETPESEVGIVCGLNTTTAADNLLDVHSQIPEGQRQTHISGRQFDRFFVSQSLADNESRKKDLVFRDAVVRPDVVIRGEIDFNHFDNYYGIPANERDISDHYPVIVRFDFK